MPVISVFFGIVVRMFYREHGVPHFHAEYQGQQATFTEWAVARQAELDANWGRLKAGAALEKIAPLSRNILMPSLPIVVRAEYRGDYRVHLTFNDGVVSTVDFSQWLDGPIFEALRDKGYFQRFFIEGGTVTWPNGADIAPETLHERAKSSVAA